MHFHRRHLTQHRFQRLVLWTLAMLSWIAAMLLGDRPLSTRHLRQRADAMRLPWLTQLVGKLLIVRAAHLARRRPRARIRFWRRGQDLRRAHLIRSVLGARVRRTLKRNDLNAWIANLVDILRHLDAHAAPLARRLRRGLTRLWRTWWAGAAALFFSRTPCVRGCLGEGGPPAYADSS